MRPALGIFLGAAMCVGACATGCSEETPCGPGGAEVDAADPYRPFFHLSAPTGWLNDPNGLVWVAGQWHVFYQHNPTSPLWGNVHWGHAVSDDLLRFETLEEALAPDDSTGQPWSGSALVDARDASGQCEGAPFCIAALHTVRRPDGTQEQHLAVSRDRGRTFTPFAGNPVLANPGITDYRDPKVFYHAGSERFVVIVGSTDQALLYASTDLREWTLLSTFSAPGTPAGAWECPDLFELPAPSGGQTRWVLKTDVNPGVLQTGPSLYWIGTFDGTTFVAETPAAGLAVDSAPDFYAAQTFSGVPDGRTLWLAWRDAWGYALLTPSTGWRGVMTVPRELSLVDTPDGLRLAQAPASELASLRGCSLASLDDRTVEGVLPLAADAPDRLELVADLEPGAATEVAFDVLANDRERTRVGYDAERAVVFVDRSESGETDFASGFGARYEAPVALADGRLRLRVLVDHTTVEVFAAEGTAVLTVAVYPTGARHDLSVEARGGPAVVRSLDVYVLAATAAPPAR